MEVTAEELRPCASHVAAVQSALQRLEQELQDDSEDVVEGALGRLETATVHLRDAFAFIDALSHGVAAASDLVEATERRLEALERGEALPDSLAQLPPAMFTAHQYVQQIRRREQPPPPELPELILLPPSRVYTGNAAGDRVSEVQQWASRAGSVATLAMGEARTLIRDGLSRLHHAGLGGET